MSEPVPPTPEQNEPKRITVEMPRDLKAVYANMAFISHTPAEVILDFAQALPRTPRGSVVSRVVMSPVHAKILQMALAQTITNYERQYGEIRIPHQRPNLADDFFGTPQEGNE
ncbi:MAG: DUF3467 domain-containing protein [Chloroflexota bacterium]